MGCPVYQLRISAAVFNQPDFDQEGLQKTLHMKRSLLLYWDVLTSVDLLLVGFVH